MRLREKEKERENSNPGTDVKWVALWKGEGLERGNSAKRGIEK